MIPINVDRNVGPAAYKAAAAQGELIVTSAFYTFQGEGPFAGRPAWFLRLSGCNLGAKKECPWCDTRFHIDEGTQYSLNLLRQLYTSTGNGCGLIVVTGGEPLLQWSTIASFINEWNADDDAPPHWQFETNGVLLTDEMLMQAEELGNASFVVSPKVIGTGYRLIPEEWAFNAHLWSLKYVVSADPTSRYHDLPAEVVHWGKIVQVYVSGQTEYGPGDVPTEPGRPVCLFDFTAKAIAQTADNYSHAAMLALSHGYRVSFQTHLLAGVE